MGKVEEELKLTQEAVVRFIEVSIHNKVDRQERNTANIRSVQYKP